LKVLDIKITTETSLINNIYENAAELIITEVKFTKKFLHAVGENCHGKKWLKIKVYIVNHTGNVHDKQSLMIIISSRNRMKTWIRMFKDYDKNIVFSDGLMHILNIYLRRKGETAENNNSAWKIALPTSQGFTGFL